MFHGIPLLNDSHLREIHEPFDIVIASQYFDIIFKRLVREKKLENRWLGQVYVPNLLGRKRPYGNNIPGIDSAEWDWLEAQLSDKRSLALLGAIKKERQNSSYPSDSFLLYRGDISCHAGFEDYWDTVPGKRKYKDAVVIDAGAYIGDTITGIVRNIGGEVSCYYALEPMKRNFEQLEKKSFKEIKEFIPKRAALGKEVATVFFEENDEHQDVSCVVNQITKNAEIVEVITLDSMSLDAETDYFVKMDIEGSEMDALIGGQNFIRDKRPNMAICLYHRERDLIEIPKFIKSIVPDYDFYLAGGSHTILIAK